MTRRRILIVGGDSLIGNALADWFDANGDVALSTTRRSPAAGDERPYLDLAKAADAVPDLPDVDAAILVAAVARIGDCEADPAGSERINVTGTAAVARALSKRGAQVIFLSTDKVFDGQVPQRPREDAPCPTTVYGLQKSAAEAAVLELPNAAVLRLSKVLAPDLPLLTGWLADLGAEQAIEPFEDLYLAPVSTELIGEVAGHIVDDCAAGIFHCTGADDRSYVDLAHRLCARFRFDPSLIAPRRAPDDTVPPAARVPHTTLDMSLEGERWDIAAPDFDDTLAALFPPGLG